MENWRNLPKLGSIQAMSHEEAFDLLQPHICEMCRRWFHPTEEEKKKNAEYVIDIDFEWEITNNMEKKDIKSGMIVEYRNGSTAICVGSEFGIMLVATTGYIDLGELNKDLSCRSVPSFDIVKIRKPSYPGQLAFKQHKDATTFWKREEKEMTLAEINAILGYTVKIIE